MRFSTLPTLVVFLIASVALGQTSSPDSQLSQALQSLVSEVRQLRISLQTSNSMAARAQVALYRLQREDEAVARDMQRLTDARSKVAEWETDKNKKALEIQQVRAALDRSDSAEHRQLLEEGELPRLKSELELLQKQRAAGTSRASGSRAATSR